MSVRLLRIQVFLAVVSSDVIAKTFLSTLANGLSKGMLAIQNAVSPPQSFGSDSPMSRAERERLDSGLKSLLDADVTKGFSVSDAAPACGYKEFETPEVESNGSNGQGAAHSSPTSIADSEEDNADLVAIESGETSDTDIPYQEGAENIAATSFVGDLFKQVGKANKAASCGEDEDGNASPSENAAMDTLAGLPFFSVTDHDVTEGKLVNNAAANKENKVHNSGSKPATRKSKAKKISKKRNTIIASNENANKEEHIISKTSITLGDITNTHDVITVGCHALATNPVATILTPVQEKKAHEQKIEVTHKPTSSINSQQTAQSLTVNDSTAGAVPAPIKQTPAAPEDVDVEQPTKTQKEKAAAQEQAAGVINRTYRGFLARKNVQAIKDEPAKHEQADPTRIQKIGRGFLARRKFAAKKAAAKTGKTEDFKKTDGSKKPEGPTGKTDSSKHKTSTPVIGNGKTPSKPPKTVSTPKSTPKKPEPKPTQREPADAHEEEVEASSGCCWF